MPVNPKAMVNKGKGRARDWAAKAIDWRKEDKRSI
jgi:hypothetical protein